MKTIIEVELVFENCESMSVPIDLIEYIYIEKIGSSVKGSGSAIFEYDYSNDFKICLHKDFEDIFSEKFYYGPAHMVNQTRFKRLQMGDIVLVKVTYHDLTYKNIYLKWNEGNECFNLNQKSYLDEYKNLIIEVK